MSGICQGCPWKLLQQRYFILLVHHGDGKDTIQTSSLQILKLFNGNSLVSLPLGLIRVVTYLFNHHTSCGLVNIWSSPQQFRDIFHRVAAACFQFPCWGTHLGASLSRFWLGLNLKREMFLEGREGICTYSMQAAHTPRWSILTTLKDSRQSYNEGCSHFFPMQHELAFHINPTSFHPAQKALRARRRFTFSRLETVKWQLKFLFLWLVLKWWRKFSTKIPHEYSITAPATFCSHGLFIYEITKAS